MTLARITLAVFALATSVGVAPPAVGAAPQELDITTIPVDRYGTGAGVDRAVELNGLSYECTSTKDSTKRNLKNAFEDSLEELLTQVRAYNMVRAQSNGSALAWTPVQPAALQCTFTTSEAYSNKQESIQASARDFGNGILTSTCEMKKDVTVAFNWNSVFPSVLPTDGRGPLPSTSASNWSVSYAGYRSCTWNVAFSGGNTLSGTMFQDFTTVPQMSPTVSYNCLKPDGKDLCVSYTYPTTVTITGGSGGNRDLDLSQVVCAVCTLQETRVASMTLLNMPFEVSALASQSMGTSFKPRLLVEGVSSKAAQAASALSLSLKKSTALQARLASPMSLKGTRTLGSGPDGSAMKLKFASAPGATCGLSAKSGTKSVSVLQASRDKDGVVNTVVTASALRSKLRLKQGVQVKIAVTLSCVLGARRKTEANSITLD